jgi:hypothetical protein
MHYSLAGAMGVIALREFRWLLTADILPQPLRAG